MREMTLPAIRKLRRQDGLTAAVAVLIVLVVVLGVAVALPWYRRYRNMAAAYGCAVALHATQEVLDVEYLESPGLSPEEALEMVKERASLCPGGGEFFLIRREGLPYQAVCGLHDEDLRRRTRLCAAAVLERVRTEVRLAELLGNSEPESVQVALNGKLLTAERTEEPAAIRHGTRATPGFDGTVIRFGLAGTGAFPPGGERVCYLCFADEEYCAIWEGGGWSGDSTETDSGA